MPDLSHNVFFSGDDDVAGEDLGGALVANFSTAVDAALRQNFAASILSLYPPLFLHPCI
jgi:hypothetical protein